MIERKEVILTYYLNSKGELRKDVAGGSICEKENGNCEIIRDNIDADLFDSLWEHRYYDDFKVFAELMKKYQVICTEYNDKLDVLVEIQVKQKSKTIIVDSNVRSTSIKLYALNIDITNSLTLKNFDKGFGGSNDIKYIEHLECDIKKMLEMALKDDQVRNLPAGFYDVILDPEATGLLVHEVIGHCFEADNNIVHFESIKGKKVAIDTLNIIDNPLLVGGYGSYEFDDEGNSCQKTYLIRDGYVNSFLTSNRNTVCGLSATGNARALSYEYQPIVRMSNTYMLPNKGTTKNDMFNETKYGLYFKGCMDSVGGKDFNLNFREGYLILNGKVECRINDMMLIGEIFKTLEQITMIAEDLVIDGGGIGGCGKQGQWPLEVSAGGPHIKISNAFIMPSLVHKKSNSLAKWRK